MQTPLSTTHLYKATGAVYDEEFHADAQHLSVSAWQLFLLFLKTGATSWGGYMSLISVVQKQVSERNRLVPDETIVKAVSLASVLPGPVAVNVVAYIGYQLKGLRGAFISMLGVLLPCFVMILVLSHLYFTYSSQPSFAPFFAGVTPAVAAILFTTSYSIGKKKISRISHAIIALLAALAVLFLHFAYTTFFIILFSGLAGYFLYRKQDLIQPVKDIVTPKYKGRVVKYALPFLVLLLLLFSLLFFYGNDNAVLRLYTQLVTAFSGLSISQFGGAFVVVPSMQKMLVDNLHWLSQQQFTDAIAMGQITPGPIYISAAVAGYKLLGIGGAAVATVAMFLPSALLMIFCSLFLARIEKAPGVVAAFTGIGAAITGMIAATGILMLYNSAVTYLPLLLLFAICLFVSIRYKVSPVLLIPCAGIAGLFLF